MRTTLDLIALEPQEIVALLIAVSFAAGLNVYATVATLGLLSQFDVIVLPEPLALLDNWWVIGACAAMFTLEFFADKVPAFDLIWNALHTFVRVPVGALLAYGAAAPLSPGWQLAAAALGGLIAFAAHAGKTAMRAAVTPSPEPLSNVGLSLVEDAVAIFLVWFATNHPFIAAAIVLVLIALMIVLIRVVVAALRALYRGARRALAPRASAGAT
jgi:hypothetical protein